VRSAPVVSDAPAAPLQLDVQEGGASEPGDRADDLARLEAVSFVRRASDLGLPPGAAVSLDGAAGHESERLLGTIVHRLLQVLGTTAETRPDVRAVALQLLRPDETAGVADRDAFAARAAEVYAALCAHPDVRGLYAASEILHEVPFTLLHGGAVVRGTIDCLVRTGPGRVSVLEFKTGRPRPEHAGQVALYATVAGQLFPGAEVSQKLIYTE
jgi:hypothetical protein